MPNENNWDAKDLQAEVDQIRNWHHIMEFAPGVITPGRYDPRGLLKHLELDSSLQGKKVLDVGARDGYFSFEAEKRGAEVIAIDYCPPGEMGFETAKRIFNSQVRFMQMNIYDIKYEKLGSFDIVLCLGLIYHLPDPYLALEIVRSVVKPGGVAYIESNCLDSGFRDVHGNEQTFPPEWSEHPVALFTRANITNYWCMNRKCLERMALDVGFEILGTKTWGKRILLTLKAVNDVAAAQAVSLARGLSKNAL
jgi:tRNA (mo5U34)-methyltransferase